MPNTFLKKTFDESMKLVGSDDKIKSDLPKTITNHLDVILSKSESSKGVLTVILTSLCIKL